MSNLLMHALHCCLSRYQQAAWALTNIGSGDSEHTQMLVAAGILEPCINLLWHRMPDVREQSAWCLGNIAGDSAALRDQCLAAGAPNRALDGLMLNISQPAHESLLRNCTWGKSSSSLHHYVLLFPLSCKSACTAC
jgi:importin subunit alpha-6/7